MQEESYWSKLARRRLSRRRLLARAAGVGTGLAALSLVGCDGGANGGGGTATPTATAPPAVTATPGATSGFETIFQCEISPRPPWEPATARGGTVRWFGFDALRDILDPRLRI